MRSKKPPKPLTTASSPAGDRADVAPRMRDPALDTGQAKPSPAGRLRQREHNGSGARTARGWRVWGGAYAKIAMASTCSDSIIRPSSGASNAPWSKGRLIQRVYSSYRNLRRQSILCFQRSIV
jgi:hypothetical protein